MLGKLLMTSYHSYTINTYSIVDWLAITAVNHGYPIAQLSSKASNQKNNDRKKKGRGKPPLPRAYDIRPSDWVKPAEFLSQLPDHTFKVPFDFFDILQDTISGREEVTAAYEAEAKADEGHAFCLYQLRRIYEVLLPRKAQNDALADNDPFIEIWKRQAQDVETNRLRAEFRDEHLEALEDYYLSSYYLMNDVINIRRYINELWIAYDKGAIDLVAVSLVTNFAIGLVRDLDGDHSLKFPDRDSYTAKVKPYFVAKSKRAGLDIMDKELESDFFNMKLADHAEDLMLGCYHTLESFIASYPFTVASTAEESKGSRNDRERMKDLATAREKLKGDNAIVINFLNDLSGFMEEDHVFLDEIMNAYRALLSTKQIDLWKVFAFQVYLDTFHMLNSNLSRPYLELKQEVEAIKKKVGNHERFCRLVDRAGDVGDTTALRHIGEAIIKDPKIFRILHRFPLRCGVYILWFRDALQSYGAGVINVTESVVPMVQLCNALHQEGLLNTPWEDLEYITEIHGYNAIFGSELPTNIAACFNQTARILPRRIQRIERKLEVKDATSITNICLDSLRKQEKRLLPDYMSNIILDLLPKLTPDDSRENKTIFLRSNIGTKEVAARWKRWGKMTPQELLGSLAIALQLEVRPFCFDYLELHRICWKVLRDIRSKYAAKSAKPYGVFTDSCLPDIIVFCMHDRIKTKMEGGVLGDPINLFEDAATCVFNTLAMGLGGACLKGLPADPDPTKFDYPTISL
ncbi:hypothetical protein AA313_de0205832 [Arthrobotrys entomopaga]|nr:hypothetical protein AA313_de0205832 [Arthrobotrys entomopaga]